MRIEPIQIRKYYEKNPELVTGVFTCGYFSHNELKKIFTKYLGNIKGVSILDLGCGKMEVAELLFDLGIDNYTGIDITTNIDVNKANKYKGKIKYICEDMHNLEKIELGNSYNVILLLDVLEHSPDPISFLKMCKSKISANGKILICVPNYFNTAGIVKIIKENIGKYKYNSWAPFSNQKQQLYERFLIAPNVIRILRKSGYKINKCFGWDIIGGTWPFIYGEKGIIGFWGRHSLWYWKINRMLWESIPILSKYCSMYFIVSATPNND